MPDTVHQTPSVVPSWAPGTYIWRILLADHPKALQEAGEAIAAVANQLDHAVDHIVILTSAVGGDGGALPWDTVWPYWQRLSNRIGGGWPEMQAFMVEMRERHRAWITFHVNLTDATKGLACYPETRAFFEQLRDAGAIYARPEGTFNQPWHGLPYVPQSIPEGDPSDIFALVNYQRYWASGLAREQIDGFLARLPYLPPLLYLDVLGPKGWCIHPGYPDGGLGGSLSTQVEGIGQIVDYIQSKGIGVASESPDRLNLLPDDAIRYSWSHGGLARNDYGQIGSGFGIGAKESRGGKAMQVYGNQGGYHLVCGSAPDLVSRTWDDRVHSPLYDGLREHGDAADLARQFHLTVAPELYHIASGAQRLPAGPVFDRLDAAEGRLRLDALTIRATDGSQTVLEAEDATCIGAVRTVDDDWASGGKTVTDLDEALGNGVAFSFSVEADGNYDLFIRYASVGGASIGWQLDDGPVQRLALPDTGNWRHYGDQPISVSLRAGEHRMSVQRERVYAEWTDGARSEWSLSDGFRATHDRLLLGIDGDRFCPVIWDDAPRILLYSRDGSRRTWPLPDSWTGFAEAQLIPLSSTGRDMTRATRHPITDLACELPLAAGESAILIPTNQ